MLSEYLRDGDSTLFGKFLFGFFAGIRVGQVRVEILIEDLCRLFAEVAPLAPAKTNERYDKRLEYAGQKRAEQGAPGSHPPRRPPGIQEAGPQDHDGLAGALLQLRLDGAELAVDDGHHALDLPRSDGPRARLLPQQVHHVGGELRARLEEGGVRGRPMRRS